MDVHAACIKTCDLKEWFARANFTDLKLGPGCQRIRCSYFLLLCVTALLSIYSDCHKIFLLLSLTLLQFNSFYLSLDLSGLIVIRSFYCFLSLSYGSSFYLSRAYKCHRIFSCFVSLSYRSFFSVLWLFELISQTTTSITNPQTITIIR